MPTFAFCDEELIGFDVAYRLRNSETGGPSTLRPCLHIWQKCVP